ncbi:MAG TPA: acyl-CoA dehydratase activase-related protein [Williamwhitmania sp.]|nr:acyl-CoA dehydratase activase-related protein [Williamwhitmania sp.]
MIREKSKWQTLFESVNIDVVVPPENSKRTIALGTKFSPESACLPLKLNLGNFIEAAEEVGLLNR